MGQLRKHHTELNSEVLEEQKSFYGICLQSEEIIERIKKHGFKDKILFEKIKKYLDEDISHNNSEDVHTMNLLYLSLKNIPSEEDIGFMKALQGLEQQTILVDDVIDNPLANEKELKTGIGFVVYKVLNEIFYETLNKSKFSSEKKLELIVDWNKLGETIYLGQTMDLLNQNKQTFSLKEYLDVISLTTASFTEYCMKLSAKTSGYDKKQENIIGEIGKYIGIAFQIRDDFYDFEKDLKEEKNRIFSVLECPKSVSQETYLSSTIEDKINYASELSALNFVKDQNNVALGTVSDLVNKSLLDQNAKQKIYDICDLIKLESKTIIF